MHKEEKKLERLSRSRIINYSLAFLFTLTCAFPLSADAKTLYVDGTSGNDATTYASNDINNKWRTIGRAAWGSTTYASPNTSQAAQAGDTVLITAGIYWENGSPTGTRYTVALNPANSGTSGNPITFRGVGDVYIRLNNGIRGPMIGCASSRNYIIWDHFIIDDTYGGSMPDTGPVVFVGSTGCQLINSDVLGHNGSYYWGYRFEWAFAPQSTVSSSGTTVTGTGGTVFTRYLIAGNTIEAGGQIMTVASITSDTQLTLTAAPSPA